MTDAISRSWNQPVSSFESSLKESPLRAKLVQVHQLFCKIVGVPSNAAISSLTYIDSGAVKKVYNANEENRVVIVARGSVLGQKEKKLENEVATKQHIVEKLREKGVDVPKNLDTVVLSTEHVNSRLKVTVESYGGGSLEKRVNGDLPFNQRVLAASQVLQGLATLHKAGYAHGDFKLENVLTKPGEIKSDGVVVGDLDKTKNVEETGSVGYKGNTRYGAPENKTSKEADTYAAGIALIRILEGEVADQVNHMLVTPQGSKSVKPTDERKGIERFVLTDERFTRTYDRKSGFPLGMALDLKARVTKPKQENVAKETEALNTYSEALCNKLAGKGKISPEQAQSLKDLITSMVTSDPEQRPTMEEAAARFNTIMGLNP